MAKKKTYYVLVRVVTPERAALPHHVIICANYEYAKLRQAALQNDGTERWTICPGQVEK